MKIQSKTYLESVKVPPRKGPRTDDTPKARPKKPTKMGRFRSGTSWTMTMMAPLLIPAEPAPAMALPIITGNLVSRHATIQHDQSFLRAIDEGAAPQITLPTSKKTMDIRNVHFVSYIWYSLPKNGLKMAHVSMYALPYHPMSEMESKVFVIAGIAVAMSS